MTLELFAPLAFIAVLLLIASEKIHRTVAALIGAALFVVIGVLNQHQALHAIDLNTLGLLIGMMIVVIITEKTGIFEQIALMLMRLSKGKPALVVTLLVTFTAFISAFLDNLTSILLVAPIAIVVAARFGMPPAPLLILQVIASNIGGAATLIGDPPNIMIAGATGLTFNEFLINLAPVAIVSLTVVTFFLYVVRKNDFIATTPHPQLNDIHLDIELAKGRELWIPLSILGTTILAFFLHDLLHIEPATVALTSATALLLYSGKEIDNVLASIDWLTIFFLAGLFVMVGGLQAVGFIDTLTNLTRQLTNGSTTAEIYGILGISAAGSALVDNIPFTAAMIPLVEQLNDHGNDAYWWALSLGACFGGNATIIAAGANVACQGVAERHGIKISFMSFLGWGLSATFISLIIAAGYLAVFHI